MMAATMSEEIIDLSEKGIETIEVESSPAKTTATSQGVSLETPKKDIRDLLASGTHNENSESNISTPVKTPKQKQKEEERLAKQKQKEEERLEREKAKQQEKLEKERAKEAERIEKEKAKEAERLEKERIKETERLEREKAKEAERQLKEQKRIEKEQERKKANEEKERLKREKKEQLQKEKEERERQRQREKDEKERQRLDEKKKKEDEKLKAEEEKKRAEQEKIRKKEKLMISNFFKPKSVVKSTVVLGDTTEDAGADYAKLFHPFFLRANVKLAESPVKCDYDIFDMELQTPSSDSKSWFQGNADSTIYDTTTAKYIFTNQLDGAPLQFKFIRFYENIKTFIGSYTKELSTSIGKNPFLRTETPFIDWDDEEEEDEEGEGEDIDEEDEEEEDDDEEGSEADLSDFLDDDRTTTTKRKALGPLVPIVHWHKSSEITLTVEILKENVTSVDPYHNYWEAPTEAKQSGSGDEPQTKKVKSLITERNDLEVFAKEVHDSDFTVPTMVELLKKKLPNYTKLTIENTLKCYAKKVGAKATEKKWEVDSEQLRKAMGVW